MKTLLPISFIILILINNSWAQKDTAVDLKEIIITSSKLLFNSGLNQYSIDSTLLINYQHLSLSELLNENSAANLKNYGSGDLSIISLRGGSAQHTSVLWNGFSLANPLHGLTDLSLENNFFFDNVSLQFGGASSIWGSGAISGSIHLNNTHSFNCGLKINAGFTYGSYNDFTEFAGVTWGNKNFSGSLKFFNKNDANNFKYYDENTNSNEEQINARIKQYGFITENYFRISKFSFLNFRIWYTMGERQIPPALLQSNSNAIQKDINTRFTSEWKHQNNNVEYVFQSALFDESLNYSDDFLIHPSNNKSKSFITNATYKKYFLKNHVLNLGLNNSYSAADSSSNINSIKINRFALFILYQYHSNNEKIELSISGRKEFSKFNNSPIIFSGGLNYYPAKNIQLRLAASSVYRNPTLNDLYWNPGGNIELNPENGFSTEFGMKIEVFQILGFNNKISASTLTLNKTLFYKKINDWIIWYPSSAFIWKPRNLMMVQSRGIEINIQYRYKKNNFTLGCDLEYFYTRSSNEKSILTNDVSLHRQLIYVPLHRWHSRLFIKFKSASLNFNHSFTGKRFTTSDNTSYLTPYSLVNVTVDNVFAKKNTSYRVFLKLNNLFNSNYQSVLNRPMPLLYTEIGISFTFIKKQEN